MEGTCFVCGNDCSSSTLVLINLETKKYKTKYTLLIGNLINSEYELRIAKSDKVCEKCSVLIEKYDELQYETKTVKSVLSRQIANTYSIETDEEPVYMDKSKIFTELRSNGIGESTKYSCKTCPHFITSCLDTVNSHIIYHKIMDEQKNTINNAVKEIKMATTSKIRVQQSAREVPKIPEKVLPSSPTVNLPINNIVPVTSQVTEPKIKIVYSNNAEYDEETLNALIDLDLLDDEFYDSNIKNHSCVISGCPEAFVYACDYVRHLKLYHQLNTSQVFPTLKSNLKRPKKMSNLMCPYCFTKTSSSEQLEIHVKQHEEIFGKVKQLDRMDDFISNLIQSCRCTICDCEILDPTTLDCNHEIVKNGMAPKLNCMSCDAHFYSDKLYNNHLALEHSQCFVCGSSFEDSNVLKDHICSHSGHSEYGCPFCKDIYQTNQNRIIHIKAKHSTQCCQHCDQWYKNSADLEHHVRFAHADKRSKDQKPCICDCCGATFKNKELFDRHCQLDHRTKKVYKCSSCRKDFLYRYMLLDHFTVAHGRTIVDNEVNFYKCCFCMKGFASRDRKIFVEHLEDHQNNSTFCFDCNTYLENASTFEIHREKIHQDFSRIVDKPIITTETATIKTQKNVKLQQHTSNTVKLSNTVTTQIQNKGATVKSIEFPTQQSSKIANTKQRETPQILQNIQVAAPSPKQQQLEIINNVSQQDSQQQIMIQNEDGTFLNMNNLMITENGELIIQNLDGILQNGQEGDEGSQIQISNLEQFFMEQGLSSNAEISYIQPDMINDGQVVIQSDDVAAQEDLIQTYKEIFEPDDEISNELISSADAQQIEHQTQNILLNGEYVLQTPPAQQTKSANNNNNNIVQTIEHVDVGNPQVLDPANQSTLDELGDILLEVAAAAEKEKKPKSDDPKNRAIRETLWGKKRQAESIREANTKRRSTKQLEVAPETDTPARNFSQAYEFFVRGFDAKKQKQA